MKTPELTREKFEELQRAHGGRLTPITIGENDIVLKAPPRPEWKRFRSMVLDPAKKADANQTIVAACLVYPPADVFGLILEERPALLDKCAEKLAELAGVDEQVVEKKFGNSSATPKTT